MRVAIVTTYRPRACGIAVFSGDLRRALLELSLPRVGIVSIVRGTPPESTAGGHPTIRQDVASDYPAAAQDLARRGTDVVLVEHEYGIFGGEAGEFVLGAGRRAHRCRSWSPCTLSCPSPPPQQAATLSRTLCRQAALVTGVHRDRAPDGGRAGLVDGGAGPGRTPRCSGRCLRWRPPWTARRPRRSRRPTSSTRRAITRRALDRLDGRTVLSTFGLISAVQGPGTGRSGRCRRSSPRAPDVLYLIAGQTHPEVVKHEGESYRLCLERLVHDLGLERARRSSSTASCRVDELAVLLARPTCTSRPYRSRGTDRLRCAHLRGGRRLPGGVDPLPLRGGPARPPAPACWCRSATSARLSRGRLRPARHRRQAGRGPARGSAGRRGPDLGQRRQGHARGAGRGRARHRARPGGARPIAIDRAAADPDPTTCWPWSTTSASSSTPRRHAGPLDRLLRRRRRPAGHRGRRAGAAARDDRAYGRDARVRHWPS